MSGFHPDMPLAYRNRVVTGDARLLAQALPDESVDLILTDPPFGAGFKYSNGYDDDPATYPDLLRWMVAEAQRVLRPGGMAFVYQGGPQLRQTLPLFPEGARIFAACKNFVQIRPTAVQWAFDPVVFWQKEGPSPRWPLRDWHVSNTARIDGALRIARARFHSCPRPVDTLVYLLNASEPGGVVVDFFGGAATTAVACRLTGRNFVVFEQDPETAALARERVRLTPEPLLVLDAPDPQETLAL